LINRHRDDALAIADALVGVGELNGAMIDEIIAGTISRRTLKIEIQRRADWARTCENAKRFQAITPAMIDTIIAAAPERARRADWNLVRNRAAAVLTVT
jgi:hypothetical protein